MGIQAKDIEMKGSKINVVFGGILLIGSCLGQPIQESLRVEDLTNRIASSGLDRNLEALDNFIKQDPEVIVNLLDQDKDGKISFEEVKKDLEIFEKKLDMTSVQIWEELNNWIAQNAPKLLEVAEDINIQ